MKKNEIKTGSVPVGTVVAFAADLNHIPENWLPCDGSVIPDNFTTLIDLLGGNRTPNLAGQVVLGAGLSAVSNQPYVLREQGGEEQHTLVVDEIPAHTHNYTYQNPIGTEEGTQFYGGSYWGPTTVNSVTAATGGSGPHNNMQPWYCLHYIIFAG